MCVCMYVCIYAVYTDMYVVIAIVVPSNIVSLPYVSYYHFNEHLHRHLLTSGVAWQYVHLVHHVVEESGVR